MRCRNDKEAMQIRFDVSGSLRVTKKESDLSCDTSGELQLRMALTRRSLAFDQAGLASFAMQEKWHSHLISALLRPPPAGHKFVTVQQILTADKELWLQMSQVSRGALKVAMGQDPPLDALFTQYMHAAEISCFHDATAKPESSSPSGKPSWQAAAIKRGGRTAPTSASSSRAQEKARPSNRC